MSLPKAYRKPLCAIALTKTGVCAALKIGAAAKARVFAPKRYAEGGAEGFDGPVAELIESLWGESGGFFLVMASGVAVRSIAPLLKSKYEDPAVVLIDPRGKFAVPLLSGHLGGANSLARSLSRKLGMSAVITTATDSSKKPAVELWARKKKLEIEDKKGVVAVNSAWANGEPVGLYVEAGLDMERYSDIHGHLALATHDLKEAKKFGGALIAVTYRNHALPAALVLRPKVLHLGVGCRLNADPEKVALGVRGALDEANLSEKSIAALASVDAKKDEPALIALAGILGVEFATFGSGTLEKIAAPNPSKRVREAVGTPSVCEAAAMASSGGGRLLMEKKSGGVWTAAAALSPVENKR